MSALYEIADRVQSKLRLDSPHVAALIPEWINSAYREVCVETECLQVAATATLSSGFATYAVPAPVLRLKSIAANTDGWPYRPLEETSVEDILRRRAGGAAGWTSAYAFAGQDIIEFWPTPQSDLEVTVYYVEEPLPLALHESPRVPKSYEQVLEYGALMQAADFLGSGPDEGNYRALYAQGLVALQRHVTRRKGGHTRQLKLGRQMSVPHDRSADIRWG